MTQLVGVDYRADGLHCAVRNVETDYRTRTDFVLVVESCDVNTSVEFNAIEEHVQMVLTFDPMHDEEWTRRMTQGHEGQLVKLEQLLY